MNHAICTLFEGSYHQGVAALANSLHQAGFKGRIYAGYRGALPTWAASATPLDLPRWPGATVMPLAEQLSLAFLPLDTQHHLTNYKPEFMLDLLAGPQPKPMASSTWTPTSALPRRGVTSSSGWTAAWRCAKT